MDLTWCVSIYGRLSEEEEKEEHKVFTGTKQECQQKLEELGKPNETKSYKNGTFSKGVYTLWPCLKMCAECVLSGTTKLTQAEKDEIHKISNGLINA